MFSASFTISDSSSDIFELRWTWWGREEYFHNGRLLSRYWDLTMFSGERSFDVNGHIVRIAWTTLGDFVARAYVDDTVRVEELFPQLNRPRKPFDWKRNLTSVGIWFVIGVVASWLYLKVTRG